MRWDLVVACLGKTKQESEEVVQVTMTLMQVCSTLKSA